MTQLERFLQIFKELDASKQSQILNFAEFLLDKKEISDNINFDEEIIDFLYFVNNKTLNLKNNKCKETGELLEDGLVYHDIEF